MLRYVVSTKWLVDISIIKQLNKLRNVEPKITGQNGHIWRGITSLNPEYS